MSRSLMRLAVLGSFLGSAASAHGATLLAASDASRIEQLDVVKVMAQDASFWLRVRVQGKAHLALVSADSAVESAPAADDWLRALDFTTRVRVTAPTGPLPSCGASQDFALIDTGLPELPVVNAERVVVASSELELRRTLEDAGLAVDAERIARFTSSVAAPFRVTLYDVPSSGGATAALRVLEAGNPSAAPQIETEGRDTVPLGLIALARAAVLPPKGASSDPSEFGVTYRAASSADPSCDYGDARASWLSAHPQRWLLETQSSSSLFAWTFLAPKASLAPAVSSYFRALPASCTAKVQDAYARGSQTASDYACADHDDLARSLSPLGFGGLRLSRLYGALGADGVTLSVLDGPERSPLVSATDVDRSACPSVVGPAIPGGMSTPNPQPVLVSDPRPGGYSETDPGTPVYTDDGGCNLTIVDSESCSGDSTPTEPSSSDSCSGDSSASDSSGSDSCSGDSKPADDGPDSCSGDSSSNSSDDSCSGDSDSSSDSGGCSKNDGYDGDTCSGSSHSSSAATASSSAALQSGAESKSPRPRRVRLSLFTLLAAALALPFRRLSALRL